MMLADYIAERYPDIDPALCADYLEQHNKIINEFGFVTYALEGDALIILDMYVKPEVRGTKQAWKMHDELIEASRQAGKRVAITFSEFKGSNQHLGLAAIKAAGFKPAFTTNVDTVFIKGIQ